METGSHSDPGRSDPDTAAFWGTTRTQPAGQPGPDGLVEAFWQERRAHSNGPTPEAGPTEVRETFWGDAYLLHRDAAGDTAGRTERKHDFWGRPAVHHFDASGLRMSRRTDGAAFLRRKYEEHRERMKREGGLWTYLNVALGFVAVLALFLTAATAWVTLPLWGGMLLVSSAVTLGFAEALKYEADWAHTLHAHLRPRSRWLGPVVAAVVAACAFALILFTGDALSPRTWSSPSVYDAVVLLAVAVIAYWLCGRVAQFVLRWRLEETACTASGT